MGWGMADLLEAIALADRVGAQAIERYGAEAQTRMLVEETGELLTAVARCVRGRGARSDVVEECADVNDLMRVLAMRDSGKCEIVTFDPRDMMVINYCYWQHMPQPPEES